MTTTPDYHPPMRNLVDPRFIGGPDEHSLYQALRDVGLTPAMEYGTLQLDNVDTRRLTAILKAHK